MSNEQQVEYFRNLVVKLICNQTLTTDEESIVVQYNLETAINFLYHRPFITE